MQNFSHTNCYFSQNVDISLLGKKVCVPLCALDWLPHFSGVLIKSLEPCPALGGVCNICISYTIWRNHALIEDSITLSDQCHYQPAYVGAVLFSCIIHEEELISAAKLLKSCHGDISESNLHIYIAPEMILLCQ